MNPTYITFNQICPKYDESKKMNIEYEKEMIVFEEKHYDTHAKVASIPGSPLFFSPVQKWEQLNLIQTHVLVYRKKLVPFQDFFKKFTFPERSQYIVSSLRHLVQGVDLLSKNGINMINYQHIGFQNNNIPLIYEFRRCEDLSYLPLEVHVLLFMQKHKIQALSENNFRKICKSFYHLNNKQLTNDVWIPLVKDFRFLFNTPYEKVKAHIASLNPKWYVYGLGCLYQDLVSDVDFETLPEEVVQLILSCKEVSPKLRPSLMDVYSALTF
jgi:hypothetical protein